jgi:hypothetical protein
MEDRIRSLSSIHNVFLLATHHSTYAQSPITAPIAHIHDPRGGVGRKTSVEPLSHSLVGTGSAFWWSRELTSGPKQKGSPFSFQQRDGTEDGTDMLKALIQSMEMPKKMNQWG